MNEWTRRELLRSTAFAAAGGLPAHARPQGVVPPSGSPLKARDVRDHLIKMGTAWVKADQTVDTFKIGDPEAAVRGIAVAWMPYTWTIKRAIEFGCNMMVVHEPLFYDHQDKNPDVFKFEGVRAKRTLLEQAGMVVYRCHDVWDQMPESGIVDAWARVLGFSGPVAGTGYFRVFEVSGKTAREVARDVAVRTARFGQEGVRLIGRADRRVGRIALGCGAITPFQRFVREYDADLAICTDDGFVNWRDGALAIDLDVPAVVVNHTVSEAEGIRTLAEYLRGAFPSVKVEYVSQECMYRLITA